MPSIEADQCFLSAVVQSYLSWTIEWPAMNVAAAQDSTSNDSVQPQAGAHRTVIGSCASDCRHSLPVGVLTLAATKLPFICTVQLRVRLHVQDFPDFLSSEAGGPFWRGAAETLPIHAFKLAVVSGQTPTRDVALLHVLNGIGMMANEVAQLEVADLLD